MYPVLRPGDVVVVERVGPDDLRPGDVVLVRSDSGIFLHRFLGRTPEGEILTRGDAHAAPDPPWLPDALLGKAVGVERRGQVLPIPNYPFCRAVRCGIRWAAGFLRLLRGLFAALLSVLFLLPALAWAAVTLVSFTATPQGQGVLLQWETASEVNMLGFTIWRTESVEGSRAPVSDLIPAEGDIVGATYLFTDTDVVPGRTYFYWLEAIEVTGASEFHGPVSATIPFLGTATPTPAPTPTPTRTPTATPTPSLTPTHTPTVIPIPSPTPTPTPPLIPTPTSTLSPWVPPLVTPTPTRTPAAVFTVTLTTTLVPTHTPWPMPHSSPSPAATRTPPVASPTPVPSSTPTIWLVGAASPGSPLPSVSTPTSSPAAAASVPVLLPLPAPPGLLSPTPLLLSGRPSPPPGGTPGLAGASSFNSLPVGMIWALLATGGIIGGGLVLWSLFLILRYRRPG